MRPYWPIVQAYCARGAWCWLATRAVLSALRWRGGFSVLSVPAVTSVEIAVAAVVMSFLDVVRRREQSFIANLAVRPAFLVVCFVIPASAGEALLRLAFPG